MSEQNKALVRRLVEELWNKRNLGAASRMLAPDYTRHDPATPDFGRGPDGYKRLVGYYTGAFPDLRFTIDAMVAEGDFVVSRWTARGTQLGSLGDFEATGREVAVTGLNMDRISADKIAESWPQWDVLGFMRQLGMVSLGSGRAAV